MKITLATGNQGKLAEFQQLLSNLNMNIVPQSDFDIPEAIENGLSFVENALIKARHAARLTGLPAIADDSGLEVDAINGAPGIYSSRFSGENATDDKNNLRLLSLLQDTPEEQRAARFQCILVYLRHPEDPTPLIFQGTWEGRITFKPEGENGFGYDPLFYVPELSCTSAQLDKEQKNKISHRGKAMAELLKQLSLVMPDSSLSLPPLSLYVHIPWCLKKCPYCDFNSHAAGSELPEEAYIQALIHDLDIEGPHTQGRKLSSIFFGGGTPSLFSYEAIGRIIQAANSRIGFEEDIEITLEANPGTFEQEKFQGYQNVGVNRLSIGVQSFNDQQLENLGRVHSAEQAISAINSARIAGFENFNIDLMHGLPGQTTKQALADLQQAIDLAPTHISWYQLTIEPNTAFYSKPPTLPKDIILEAIQEQGYQLLLENGYQQYEVSAFCRDNNKSAHNLNYWKFGDYLGIGAGAHGKITLPSEQRIIRTTKTRSPADYLAREHSYTSSCKNIPEDELPLEFMMNAMRLNAGVPAELFSKRTSVPLETIQPALDKLATLQLIENSDNNLIPTQKGHQFLNNLLEIFDEQNSGDKQI